MKVESVRTEGSFKSLLFFPLFRSEFNPSPVFVCEDDDPPDPRLESPDEEGTG